MATKEELQPLRDINSRCFLYLDWPPNQVTPGSFFSERDSLFYPMVSMGEGKGLGRVKEVAQVVP